MTKWELLILSTEYIVNEEGFVVDTYKGLVKIKHSKYVDLHRLKDSIGNMKNLIGIILSDNIDDVIGQFQEDKETVDYIVETQTKVGHKFNHMVVEWKELRNIFYNQCNSDRKTFAIKYSKNPLFGSVIKNINGSFRDVESIAEKSVEEYILRVTNSLGKAKEWVAKLEEV